MTEYLDLNRTMLHGPLAGLDRPFPQGDITVTDQFCGCGGSSEGAERAGLKVRLAINHWKQAVETHAANFPHVDHVCEDVQSVDPRRYPRSDFLITSPECTNHSLAQGARRKNAGQKDLFNNHPVDPTVERSRATMWDVVRFAEFHRYRIVIVENVVDVRYWELWEPWLAAMHALGYLHRLVSLNSMFCHPTPQSRDRAYIVFWRRGNRAPDLEVRPLAPCPKCGDVEAVQSWKINSRTGALNDAGRFKRQYVFTCPTCRDEVTPYYYAALNAIDWTISGVRIGDRPRPLKERTLERIRYGLERYGRAPLMIQTRHVTGTGHRVRPASEALGTVTGSGTDFGMASPFLVETLYTHSENRRPTSVGEALPTQSTRSSLGLCTPFLTSTNYFDDRNIPISDPCHTLTTQTKFGLTIPAPFLVTLRGTQDGQLPSCPVGLHEPVGTISAGGIHHALIHGGALLTMRDDRLPFLVQYYGNDQASSTGAPIPTVTSVDRHALIEPGEELKVEDCYFRMLVPHELQAGMAFPPDYKVLGNNRDKVKQIGNAVTPPAMSWLIRRCVASLHPEVM